MKKRNKNVDEKYMYEHKPKITNMCKVKTSYKIKDYISKECPHLRGIKMSLKKKLS